jgi:myosin heavy subunit
MVAMRTLAKAQLAERRRSMLALTIQVGDSFVVLSSQCQQSSFSDIPPQSRVRSTPVRKQFQKLRQAVILAQSLQRRRRAGAQLRQLRIEARSIGEIRKQRDSFEQRVKELENKLQLLATHELECLPVRAALEQRAMLAEKAAAEAAQRAAAESELRLAEVCL